MSQGIPQPLRTVVVGSGLAGLSAAVRLVDAGASVTLVERASVVGGRTSNWDDDGMEVESGLHRYLGFYVELPRLLRHVGQNLDDVVAWEDQVAFRLPDRGPKAVYSTSVIHKPISSLVRGLGNNHYVNTRQKLALARMLASGVRDYLRRPQALDQISVADYARKHGVDNVTVHRILVPLTEGLFFVPPQEYSAHNFMGLLVPYWNSVLKTRVGGFAGGMTDVMAQPLANYITHHGGTVHVGRTVTELLVRDGKVTGVATDQGPLEADAVVLAASLGPAQRLIQPALGHLPWFGDMLSLESTPSVCFQVELDRPSMRYDRATFAPGTSLASFSEQSRTTFRHLPGRFSIILGRPRDFLDAEPEQILRHVVDEAKRIGLTLEGHVTNYRKVAIPEDFYSLSVGNEHLRPGQNPPVDGLYLAGDYTRQKYLATMEGAVVSGQRAADALVEDMT